MPNAGGAPSWTTVENLVEQLEMRLDAIIAGGFNLTLRSRLTCKEVRGVGGLPGRALAARSTTSL